jgi:signal transduction histidine kinase
MNGVSTGSAPHWRLALPSALTAAVALIATLVIIGWLCDVNTLKRIVPGLVAMNPATAVAFMLGALSLYLHGPEPAATRARRGARVCAAVVLVIGMLRLGGYLVGWEAGVDQILFGSALAEADDGKPNRMAPNTALGFILTGVALLALDLKTRRGYRPAALFALGAAAIGLVALIGYAYGQRSLYGVASFIPMALHTAVAFMLLGSGILVARLDRGLTAVLMRASAGGVMARRLLPAAVAVPFVLGWLCLAGRSDGLYPSEFGTALLVVATMLVFTAMILITSWSLDRADGERQRAQAELHQLNQELEKRVTERTAELEAANSRLWDEARIAADLARVGREVIVSLDAPKLLDRLCHATMAALESDFSHVFLLRPEESVYVPVAGCGDSAEQWEALRPLRVPQSMLAGLLARLERDDVVQVRMSDPQDLIPAALPERYGITLALYMAIRRGHQIAGILTAGYRGGQEPFSEHQERTGRGIAHLASLALENARLVEQIERANRLKSEFVSTMSHELRTPLNAIIGYTSLLSEGEFEPLTPAQAEVLRQVETSSRALLALVEQVLDLSRLEKEDIALELREIVLTDLARDLDAFAQQLPQTGGVRFRWSVEPPASRLLTDEAKLRVVLKSIISNSFKFTDEGEVNLTVRASTTGVEILVRDTGIGIAPEHHSLIFEPFRQVEPYLTRRYGGVGLGLYLVRRLLEMLDGNIAVESVAGGGATFRVWVPQAASEARPLPEFDVLGWTPQHRIEPSYRERRWIGEA